MLANLHNYATLPASDIERAKRFYAEKLGLTPEREAAGGFSTAVAETLSFFCSHLKVPLAGAIPRLAGSLTTLRQKWQL